jgi:CRISPR/Cas system CMR subunit Cmr4 (Cas7 group RAMP superfamily)
VSEEVLVEVFGPERETTLARGAVEFSGARLLALPLRSVHGTWVLATCPLALARLARECPDTPPIPTPVSPDRVLWGEHNPGFRRPSVGAEPIAVIEGLPFLPERQEGVALWAAWLSDWSADVPGERLAVLHDETFQHAVQFWTECRTRNAMKDGVVVEHQLFTTEHLPAETLLWGVLHASVEGGVPRGALPEDTDSWGLGGQRSVGTGRVAWYRRSA